MLSFSEISWIYRFQYRPIGIEICRITKFRFFYFSLVIRLRTVFVRACDCLMEIYNTNFYQCYLL